MGGPIYFTRSRATTARMRSFWPQTSWISSARELTWILQCNKKGRSATNKSRRVRSRARITHTHTYWLRSAHDDRQQSTRGRIALFSVTNHCSLRFKHASVGREGIRAEEVSTISRFWKDLLSFASCRSYLFRDSDLFFYCTASLKNSKPWLHQWSC